MKKGLLLSIFFLLFINFCFSLTRYWVGPVGGAYSNPSNWNTASNGTGSSGAPVNTDNIVIDRDATLLIDGTYSPSSLWIINNAVVEFTTANVRNYIVGGGSVSPAFKIENGASLNITGTAAINLTMSFASSCEIYGVLDISGTNSKMDYFSAGTTRVKNGGKIRYGGNSSNGTGSSTTLFMESGSVYEIYKNAGVFPTGNYNPNSLILNTGATTTPASFAMSATFGNYGNYEFNSPNYTSTTAAVNQNVNFNNFSLSTTGTGRWIFSTNPGVISNPYTLTVNGNLFIYPGCILDINDAISSGSLPTTILVKGNIDNYGEISENNVNINSAIQIGGAVSATYFSVANGITNDVSFIMNKTAGAILTALSDVILPYSSNAKLTFTSGNIDVQSNNYLVFVQNSAANALVTGTVTSHVIGKMKRNSNQSAFGYSFPVSNNASQMAKALITVNNSNFTEWTVEFHPTNPNVTNGLTPGSIDVVSNYYWDIFKNGGANATYTTFYYGDLTSSTVLIPAQVKVLRWNVNIWNSLGGVDGGGSVDNTLGTLGGSTPNDPVTAFGQFALGGITGTLAGNLCNNGVVHLFAQDTLRVCGDSIILNAGAGFSVYNWNTGANTQTIIARSTGWYKATVTQGACTGSDSVFVSLVNTNIVNANTTICKGEWISLSVVYTPIQSNPLWSTGVSNSSIDISPSQTTTYYCTVSNGISSCTDSVTITVTSVDTSIAITGNTTFCNGDSVSLQAAINSTYHWLLNGNAIPGADLQNYTATQSGIYCVALTNSLGCRDTSRSITVTVNSIPTSPSVSTPINYCKNTIPNPLSATGTGTFLWYTAATGGVGSSTAPVISTSTVGTTTYYVSQTNAGNCEGPRAAIVVNVNDLPFAPAVSSPVNYCKNATANPLTAAGSSLLWYNAPNGGVGSSSAPIVFTSIVGATSYYVSQTNTNNCESPRTVIVVNINDLPSAPGVTPLIDYCKDAIPNLLTATGSGLLWYSQSAGGTGNTTAPVVSTANVGTNNYYVSQTINGCEGARASIVVNVNTSLPAPTVVSPINYCKNVTPNPLTATGTGTLLWYTAATGGVGNSTPPVISTSTVGTITYYVSQANASNCEGPMAAIVVNVNDLPFAPAVSSPVNYCKNATANPLTATGSSLLWYNAANGGVGSLSAPIVSTSVVGATSYYVSQTNTNNCESPRALIVVNINDLPSAPGVTSTIDYCKDAIPNPLTATGSGLLWYNQSIGGIGNTTAPLVSTANVGTSSYYVSQTINGCEGPRASVVVNVNTSLPAPTVLSPIYYCKNASPNPLSAIGTGSLLWYTAATGGVGSSAVPVISTSTVGTQTYYVSQANAGNCEGPRAAIVVNVNDIPVAPVVISQLTYCKDALPTVLTATGSGLLWYTSNNNVGNSVPPVVSTASVGNTIYYVTQTNASNCESPKASITVNIINSPYKNLRYTSVNAMENRDLQLEARILQGGIYEWMPQTSLNNYAVYNPLFNSNTEHKYTIMIKTPDGCISVDTLLVRMFKQVEIYVPSGFSPNGDHHNDVLLPQLVGVKELKYFKVFDRWGQLVYQTNEFGKGWDGVYKGTRQPMESYLWIAEGIDVYGKAIKRTGSSILVR